MQLKAKYNTGKCALCGRNIYKGEGIASLMDAAYPLWNALTDMQKCLHIWAHSLCVDSKNNQLAAARERLVY